MSPGVCAIDPEVVRRAIAVIHAVDNASTLRWLTDLLGRRPDEAELDPVTWDMAREGETLTAVDHASAIDDLHAQARTAALVFSAADLVLCPTLNVLPPPPGSLSGVPGHGRRPSRRRVRDDRLDGSGQRGRLGGDLAARSERSTDSPVGVQLLAPDEAVLLRVAAQLKIALPWTDRRPPGYL